MVVDIFSQTAITGTLFNLFDETGTGWLDQDSWFHRMKKGALDLPADKAEAMLEFVDILESTTYSVCRDGLVDLASFRRIVGSLAMTGDWPVAVALYTYQLGV